MTAPTYKGFRLIRAADGWHLVRDDVPGFTTSGGCAYPTAKAARDAADTYALIERDTK